MDTLQEHHSLPGGLHAMIHAGRVPRPPRDFGWSLLILMRGPDARFNPATADVEPENVAKLTAALQEARVALGELKHHRGPGKLVREFELWPWTDVRLFVSNTQQAQPVPNGPHMSLDVEAEGGRAWAVISMQSDRDRTFQSPPLKNADLSTIIAFLTAARETGEQMVATLREMHPQVPEAPHQQATAGQGCLGTSSAVIALVILALLPANL